MNSLSSNLFEAVVTSSDAGTYNVIVEPVTRGFPPVLQGVPLMQVYASALGFRECNPYPVGTSVLCYYASPLKCYILGIVPAYDSGNFGFFNRALLKTGDSTEDTQNTIGYASNAIKFATYNQNRPTDITEGEVAYANDLGVMLSLFQQFAALKGSELAQVQCFLLDDLVRIISHNFQHWSALGEFNIWHDGKGIQAEFGATHLSTESLGTPSITEKDGAPIFTEDGSRPTIDDEKDYYKLDGDNRLKAVERLKGFVGKLGDFLHVFMVKPDDTEQRDLSGELKGQHDTGLADFHLGLDGRISFRTTSAFSIEKTNWIMVPHRVRTPEDPKGDNASEIEYEKKDPFEFDNQYKVRENPIMYFLQMRDCVTYLQNKYNYQNFVKHEKDFKLSKDPNNKEKNLAEITDVDPYTKVNFADYVLRRSGLYLMDNGGFMLTDAWGSAIVSEGGNIYLQPAKDLIEQPLRHKITKAGGAIALNAKGAVDISSTEEGMRVRTDRVQHYFAKNGGLIFQTDSEQVQKPSPEDEAYTNFGGILFLAPDSAIFQHAKKIIASADDIILSVDKTFSCTAEEEIKIKAKTNCYVLSDEQLYVSGERQTSIISNNTVNLAGNTQTNLGKNGNRINMIPSPGSLPASMDGVIPVDTYTSIIDTIKETTAEINKSLASPFPDKSVYEKIKFRYLKSDEYNLTDDEDFIPMTIAQQDDATFHFTNLVNWNEIEEESTLPFPGKEKFEEFYITAELKNFEKKEEDATSKAIDGLAFDSKLEKKSLKEYKVYE